MAGAHVVASLLGFKMFIVVVEADMAAGEGFGIFFVVFDVICLEAFVAVVNVHVVVSNEKVAVLLLWAARPDLDVAGFAGVQADLLRPGIWQGACDERKKKRYEKYKGPERGRNPGMRATIHAEHLCDENCWIA